MKTLIIKAHPSTQGFTHTIADAYKEAREGKDGEVFIIDLYTDMEYQQPFLAFENVREEWSGKEVRERIQEKIAWADELIFIYPVWWSGMPAIMKNFIDNNFTKGFAYKTGSNGRPKGALVGKTVRIFSTADGPWILHFLNKSLLKPVFAKSIFGFCGMKLTSFDIFSNMIGCKDACDRDAMLAKVRARV